MDKKHFSSNPHSIEEAWKQYVNAVLPFGYSKMQYKQLYMSFISGTLYILTTLNEISTDETKTEEEKENIYMNIFKESINLNQKLVNEFCEFSKNQNPELN